MGHVNINDDEFYPAATSIKAHLPRGAELAHCASWRRTLGIQMCQCRHSTTNCASVCVCFAKVYEVAQGDNTTISFGNTVVTKTWHLASMAFDEAVLGRPHHQRCDFNSFRLRQQKFGQPAQDHMSGTNDGPSRLTGSIRNTTSLWHLGWTFLKVRTTPSSGTHHIIGTKTDLYAWWSFWRPPSLLFTFN